VRTIATPNTRIHFCTNFSPLFLGSVRNRTACIPDHEKIVDCSFSLSEMKKEALIPSTAKQQKRNVIHWAKRWINVSDALLLLTRVGLAIPFTASLFE